MSEYSRYIISGPAERLDHVSAVDDRIQSSRAGCAIFYYLHKGEEAEARLRQFLKSHNPEILILNRELPVDCTLVVAHEDNWLDFQKSLCDRLMPLPSKSKVLAITGTNGKTTTADLTLQLATLSGLHAISIGTLGVRGPQGLIEDFGLTTPSFIQLRRIFYQHAKDCDVVAMEASSHALDQNRVLGLVFHAAAWTSFTQDHLDYHKSMDSYFAAKKKIFSFLRLGGKVYFPSSQAHVADQVSLPESCVVLPQISEKLKQSLPPFFKTKFNLDNLSVALALVAEVQPKVTEVDVDKLTPTPGRFYIKEWENRAAIVDFAHTPDALENLLSAVRESYPNHKLKVLFGCGGDRDRSKRPLMGLAVQKFADEIILTSDNPRTEDPLQIIEDIAKPLDPVRYRKIVDRPSAVMGELAALGSGEILVLAGKGHEDYIIKGTTKHKYSDIETLDQYLLGKRA